MKSITLEEWQVRIDAAQGKSKYTLLKQMPGRKYKIRCHRHDPRYLGTRGKYPDHASLDSSFFDGTLRVQKQAPIMKYLIALALILSVPSAWSFDPRTDIVETRYCGPPARYADGRIKRSTTVLRYFQIRHPCPSTGLKTGPCPDWAMDHVIPLACGGCDAVFNLQWFPNELKSGKGLDKDRWERKVYAADPPIPDTGNCVNEVVK